MTYQVLGIPSATDVPAQSQAQIQTNFNNIIGWSGVDHVQFGAQNAGTHNQVTILTPASGDPTLSGAQGEYYTKNVSGVAQAFFANSSVVAQLTGSIQISSGTAGGGNYQVFQTPWGLRLFTGRTTYINGNQTITMSADTFGSVVYLALGGGFGGGSEGVAVTPNANANTTSIWTTGRIQCFWFVISN